jgi:uncharacterized protein YlxW (UPF0749 family)
MDETRTDSRPEGADRSGAHRSGPVRRPTGWLRRAVGGPASRGVGWRLATPVALLGAGVLMVTSGVNSAGTDLRPSPYADLGDLAQQETDRVSALQDRVAELSEEVDELTEQQDSGAFAEIQAQIDALSAPAGLTAMEGPGVTVTLTDAPEAIRESAGEQVEETIVHQQDIQAVANALWSGGAEAMTLQGQRVVSTTGIKCVGNTVLLHGVTYSPPYVISAIGDPVALQDSLGSSPYIQAYRAAVEQWRLGWDVDVDESIEAPAYAGPTDMQHARAAGEDAFRAAG